MSESMNVVVPVHDLSLTITRSYYVEESSKDENGSTVDEEAGIKSEYFEEVVDIDTYFFEPSYNVATATGFSIWDASRKIACLCDAYCRKELAQISVSLPLSKDMLVNSVSASSSPQRLKELFDGLVGKKVVELGAGTGLAGLALAVTGAHVLLTDVEAVCEGVLSKNIEQNASFDSLASSGLTWTFVCN